jgi:hypothetical protein
MPTLEEWQQLVADPVSGDLPILVHGVFVHLEVAVRRVGLDRRAAHLEHGPYDTVGASGTHGPKARGPGAAQQTQQNGLGLIVGMVADGYPASADLEPDARPQIATTGTPRLLY